MKKKSLVAVLLLLCCVFYLSSCANNDDIISNEEVVATSDLAISDPQIKKEIEFMRSEEMIDEATYNKWQTLSKRQILFTGGLPKQVSTGVLQQPEYYIYSELNASDGMMIHREDVQKLMQEKEKGDIVSSRMKRQPHMFDSNGGTITIRVVESGPNAVPIEWKQALGEAILTWNNLGLKVKFKKVTATTNAIAGGYITLWVYPLSNSPTAFAYTHPINSAGYFSEAIIINSASYRTPDLNGKKFAMIHELGHAVGLMHTEAVANNNTIYNTAVTCNETNNANSFMYGSGAATQLFTGFTTCDRANLNYYWGNY